ncbi:radical SAM protein [Dissulfurirhabdus thermomarina]|uniref:radical SAM protein n=1 Tax=Dissulfurirhabdus thermomarina TaxID=1765737 RepID=UPI002852E71B|nr:radical SAM protein [Dissulfurirhabdus thermomarina]
MPRVAETFTSLQGEGTAAGRPCFFIRMAGCNLRCTYCDTAYAWEGGETIPPGGLVGRWRESGVPLVEVTGGEPLLQPETPELLGRLLAAGAEVLLETNGSLPLDPVPPGVTCIVDRKTPGSGVAGAWRPENLARLRAGDQVKFVLTGRADYDWAVAELGGWRLPPGVEVLFSPAWGRLAPADLAEWILADRLPVRFQLQLHKLLWGDRQGV